jgi:hypothetical protein
VDEKEYNKYLSYLFGKSKKFVLVFSSNYNAKKVVGNYIYHRKFTDWVDENYKNFELIEEIDNFLHTSAKFYLFKKIE